MSKNQSIYLSLDVDAKLMTYMSPFLKSGQSTMRVFSK